MRKFFGITVIRILGYPGMLHSRLVKLDLYLERDTLLSGGYTIRRILYNESTNQRGVFYRFEEEDNISNNELGIRTSSNTASNITNNSNIDDYINFGDLEESNRDTFDSY